jgi:hypothetical protein
MSFSKTRTTYRPSTHPQWKKGTDVQISIHVTPAPTLEELRAMRDQVMANPLPLDASSDEGRDQTAWKHALNLEVTRCTPKLIWMRRQNQSGESVPPTQHARIDPAQVEQLKGILKPETLRRTFISIPALMAQIQADIAQSTN